MLLNFNYKYILYNIYFCVQTYTTYQILHTHIYTICTTLYHPDAKNLNIRKLNLTIFKERFNPEKHVAFTSSR